MGKVPNNPDTMWISVSVQNNARFLGLILPATYIFGHKVKNVYGKHFVERDTAVDCRAVLLDKSGRHICHLWWRVHDNETIKIADKVNIPSSQSASVLLFMKKDSMMGKYFVYQPISNEDLTHKSTDIPVFKSSKKFILKISYGLNGTQILQYPIQIRENFGQGFTIESNSGSTTF